MSDQGTECMLLRYFEDHTQQAGIMDKYKDCLKKIPQNWIEHILATQSKTVIEKKKL